MFEICKPRTMLSNKYILYFVFFISLNVAAQSVLITPEETLLNSEVNRLIIGKDSSSLNADFPLYLNQPLSNRVFVGLKGISSSAYLGLNNSAKSIKFEIGVSLALFLCPHRHSRIMPPIPYFFKYSFLSVAIGLWVFSHSWPSRSMKKSIHI